MLGDGRGLDATFHVATGGTSHPAAAASSEPLSPSADIQPARNGPFVIDQAMGILMGVHGCDADDARRLLDGAAQDSGAHVLAIAAALTTLVGVRSVHTPDDAVRAVARAHTSSERPDEVVTVAHGHEVH